MKKLLIMSLCLVISVLSFMGDAFSCGMMRSRMMRSMSYQDRTQEDREEETSHALSHSFSHDNEDTEKDNLDADVEPARLVEKRCSRCHSLRFISQSRKSDWSRTVYRMNSHLMSRNMPSLTDQEKRIIISYLNGHYSTAY